MVVPGRDQADAPPVTPAVKGEGLNTDTAPTRATRTATDRVADYRLDRVLGRGGMGVVHLATHEPTGRVVALKLLPPTTAADETTRQRFLREGQTLKLVSSEYVCRFVDAGEVPSPEGLPPTLFLAMEYVPGKHLHDVLLENGPLPADQLAAVARHVSLGLQAIHDAGLIHRDLKPANVIWQEDRRRAILIDFGVVRALDATTALTQASIVLGTPQFMAPEQMRGEVIDGRADLFALGVLLYNLATGHPPFAGETLFALQQQVLYGFLSPVGHSRPDLPEPLARLIDRLLLKDRNRRPASGREAAAMLDAAPPAEAAAGPVGGRVLIADDDPILVKVMQHHLKRWGLAAAVAGNGPAVFEELGKGGVAAVLLDVQLGDSDGLSIAPDILRAFPGVSIFVLTAHGSIERAVAAVKAGCQDFFTKPPDLTRLKSALVAALARHD